jgi:hypothetical protein
LTILLREYLHYFVTKKENMSRLIDKFQKAAKSSVQTMGFRAVRSAAPEPGILLIVSVAPVALKNSADIGKAGAVLIRPESAPVTAAGVKKIVDTLPEIPVGLYVEDAANEEITELAESGIDFIVFPPSGRISPAPEDKKSARILQVESSMDDSLLRAVNSLPVDAVLAADTFTGGAMSWHELMIFQHLANSFIKPLIVNIPPDITETELRALFEAGVDGAVVDASALKAGGLKKLLELIGKLPPRSARKRGKIDVFLPRAGGEAQPPTSPPDEEEEDE